MLRLLGAVFSMAFPFDSLCVFPFIVSAGWVSASQTIFYHTLSHHVFVLVLDDSGMAPAMSTAICKQLKNA